MYRQREVECCRIAWCDGVAPLGADCAAAASFLLARQNLDALLGAPPEPDAAVASALRCVLSDAKVIRRAVRRALSADCGICAHDYDDEGNRRPVLLAPCSHALCAVCAAAVDTCPYCRGAVHDRVAL